MTTKPELLPLADVHVQAVPSYWPLAWGWWAVIVAILCLIVLFVISTRHHKQNNLAKNEALNRLKQLKSTRDISALNALLKQVALTYFPREEVAKLTGKHWMTFLDSSLDEKKQGFVALEKQWQSGLFSNAKMDDETFDRCYKQAHYWLKKVSSQSVRNKE